MKNGKEFYPDYLIEILIVIFILLEATLILALLYPPAIGRQIDFSAPFQPLPEWYFLWLYQLVRYFPGKFTFLGAVVIPCAAILILIGIPFIDRRKHGRIIAITAGLILLLTFLIMTVIPLLKP
jgi:quinol-cytochrome oxidoreductase complex cytochrome b subunit